MPRLRLTQQSVQTLSFSEAKQLLYFDDGDLRGFGVLIGRDSKTFVYQRDVGGRTRRVTIGRFPALSVREAKSKAYELYLRMKDGEDPNLTRRKRMAVQYTLGQALDDYVASPKPRSPRTIEGYRDAIRLHFSDWLARPLADLTRWDVKERHKRIGRTAPYAANQAMRVFRAIYNSALRTFEDLPAVNPTIAVEWFPETRRSGIIFTDKMCGWYRTLSTNLDNPIRRHFYVFLLLTGLRRESAATLEWTDLAKDLSSIRIKRPKGGEVRAFDLPLTKRHIDVLRRLYLDAQAVFPGSRWLFPAYSKTGHIEEPRLNAKQLEHFESKFSPHTLRRTFVTTAKEVGIHPYDMKLLVNHALPNSDVTAGYTGVSPSTRAAMEAITTRIDGLLGQEFESAYPRYREAAPSTNRALLIEQAA